MLLFCVFCAVHSGLTLCNFFTLNVGYESSYLNYLYSFSIQDVFMKSQDYPLLMADSLLDVLTKGGHSRALRELEMVRVDLCTVWSLALAHKRKMMLILLMDFFN